MMDKAWFCWLATRSGGVEAQILYGHITRDDKARILEHRMLAEHERSIPLDDLIARYPLGATA